LNLSDNSRPTDLKKRFNLYAEIILERTNNTTANNRYMKFTDLYVFITSMKLIFENTKINAATETANLRNNFR
jgi:hypothetical protein